MPHDRLRPISRILNNLQQQTTWEPYRKFRLLLNHWPSIVGEMVARQARPIALRGNTLYVATASAAWAQTLVFERTQILAKLNAVLPNPLQDIRFSTAHWALSADGLDPANLQEIWEHHPSRIDGGASQDVMGNAETLPEANFDPERTSGWDLRPGIPTSQPVANAADRAVRLENANDPEQQVLDEAPGQSFERWAARVKARSQALPECPRCQCPTPIGELQRWQVCATCHAMQPNSSS